jgi:protein-S-isoprenylcysteine O-methyltransferase Ste14
VIGTIYGAGFLIGYTVPLGPMQPVAVVLGERLGGGPGVAVLLWAAVASALVAWFWRASGTAYLRQDVVFAADVQRDRLIVAGVFRYIRNPLYVGNVFLALAAAVMAPPLGFAIIMAGNVAIVIMLAGEESRGMAERYGPIYEAYRRAVPAFVPRLTPAEVPGSADVVPSIARGLLAEAFCLALAVALVPVALFGQAGLPAFYVIWILGLIVWGTAGWMAGRKHTSGTGP